ncbi:hypothetical protein GLOIN_2v1775727 [Rhizophagus clarus]|uniref:Uncharacterized protein n=1 Tax=Rhizophagus clarus TaxID=94130 RepID=A0A8H3QSG0_9GLOM|nr:hypothetical protein GLOIN_2v1775727 [Rhizophagus clarus]
MSTTSSLFAVTPTPSASVPLIITSTTNLTTDKKRDHLFDIDHVLEIPIEDFNDKSLVKIEAAKNYLPLAITSAIKEYATLELGLGEYARELRHKEVANIKYKVQQEYRVKSYRVPQRSTKDVGIVISKPRALQRVFPAWPLKNGVYGLVNIPLLLLQVTSTNSIESFYSKLKKVTSSLYGLIGTVHGIVNIDCKKRSKAKSVSFDFRIKKVSAYGKSNKLLIAEVWQMFHKIFKESGFEVYESQESFIKYVQTEQQKGAENQKIAVGELTERMRDKYWHVEEMGDAERTQSFISMLEASVDLIISHFDDNSNGKT